MADENFMDNPFYIALSKQFSDLYAKACAKKCIICIPQKSSLRVMNSSLGRPRPLIHKAELGLHILQPSPLQSLEEGLYDCIQNGYSVKIEKSENGRNGRIKAYSGFGRNFSAEILSEEKCYDEKSGGSFTLLMIDHPLGEGMDVYNKALPTLNYSLESLSLATCEGYLREYLGPAEAGSTIIATFKKSIEQLYRTYVLLEGYLDDLANKIQAVVTRAVDESVRAVPSISRKDTSAAFEVFGHNILHHKIFKFLYEQEYADQEAAISRNMEEVKKPEKIDRLNITNATFPMAASTLMKLPNQTSPLQQLVCIAQGLKNLQEDLIAFQKEQVKQNRIQTSAITLAADDTLNLLLFILSSKRIPHLKSSLVYMMKFCWTIPDASLQYALTTFEAAVRFLEASSDDFSDEERPRSRNCSAEEEKARGSSIEYEFVAPASEWDWGEMKKSACLSNGIPSRPASSSPIKSTTQIDGKLKNLSLMMDEGMTSRRSNSPNSSVETASTKAASQQPTAKSQSPLDFLSGSLSFGKQK